MKKFARPTFIILTGIFGSFALDFFGMLTNYPAFVYIGLALSFAGLVIAEIISEG